MHTALAGRVRARIGELGPLVSDAEFEDGVVLHCDASFANVLWYQGRLAALLDLEWARLGPADLELATISGDDADIQARGSSRAVPACELPLLTWFRVGHPELFDREHLTERVWRYGICFRIRQLVPGVASIRVRFRTWPASPCTQGCASLNGTRSARRQALVSDLVIS